MEKIDVPEWILKLRMLLEEQKKFSKESGKKDQEL